MEKTKGDALLIEDQGLPPTLNDVVKSAETAGLVYVLDNQPGYTRIKNEKGFHYFDGNKHLKDEEELRRIRSLVLPPAWKNVWICKLPNGHLQATGYDKLNRKQYKYHNAWVAIRNQTKYSRLLEFCEILPMVRENLKRDLSRTGFPQRKVLAAVVSLLEKVNIRIGNSAYEKMYGSFGLTTLKNRHVKINGTQLQLSSKGKKGVRQNITFTNRRLVRIIKGCRDIPGKELFEYYDENGNIHSVDSGMVNNYIREISEGEFTAKDFRTWAGTIHAIRSFKVIGEFETQSEMNRKINMVLDSVATKLGNTRAVCKKYYVHPLILDLYKEKKLEEYLKDHSSAESISNPDDYEGEEKVLLKILKDVGLRNQN